MAMRSVTPGAADDDDDTSDDSRGPSPYTQSAPRRRWTSAEDALLRQAVAANGGKNWKKVAETLPTRTEVQCLHRWQKVLDPTVLKGNWTKEEDETLMDLVQTFGAARWSLIAGHLKGRIGKQCRERWSNHLCPDINKGPWTEDEDRTIIEVHAKLGNRWADIAKYLPGRTDNAIKNHFNSTLRRNRKKDEAAGERPQSASSAISPPTFSPRQVPTGVPRKGKGKGAAKQPSYASIDAFPAVPTGLNVAAAAAAPYGEAASAHPPRQRSYSTTTVPHAAPARRGAPSQRGKKRPASAGDVRPRATKRALTTPTSDVGRSDMAAETARRIQELFSPTSGSRVGEDVSSPLTSLLSAASAEPLDSDDEDTEIVNDDENEFTIVSITKSRIAADTEHAPWRRQFKVLWGNDRSTWEERDIFWGDDGTVTETFQDFEQARTGLVDSSECEWDYSAHSVDDYSMQADGFASVTAAKDDTVQSLAQVWSVDSQELLEQNVYKFSKWYGAPAHQVGRPRLGLTFDTVFKGGEVLRLPRSTALASTLDPLDSSEASAVAPADEIPEDTIVAIPKSRIKSSHKARPWRRQFKVKWGSGDVTWEERDTFWGEEGTVTEAFQQFEEQRTGLIGTTECDWAYPPHSSDTPVRQADGYTTITAVQGATLTMLAKVWKVELQQLLEQNLYKYSQAYETGPYHIGRLRGDAGLTFSTVFNPGEVLRLPRSAGDPRARSPPRKKANSTKGNVANRNSQVRPINLCKDLIEDTTGLVCQTASDLVAILGQYNLVLDGKGAHRGDHWLLATLQLMRALGKFEEITPALLAMMREYKILGGASRSRSASATVGGSRDHDSTARPAEAAIATVKSSRLAQGAEHMPWKREYCVEWVGGGLTWEGRDAFWDSAGGVTEVFQQFEEKRTGLMGSSECDWEYSAHPTENSFNQPDGFKTVTTRAGDTIGQLSRSWRVDAQSMLEQNLFRYSKANGSGRFHIGDSPSGLTLARALPGGQVLRLPRPPLPVKKPPPLHVKKPVTHIVSPEGAPIHPQHPRALKVALTRATPAATAAVVVDDTVLVESDDALPDESQQPGEVHEDATGSTMGEEEEDLVSGEDTVVSIIDTRLKFNEKHMLYRRQYRTLWRSGETSWEGRDTFWGDDGSVTAALLECEVRRTKLVGTTECEWEYPAHSADEVVAQPDGHSTVMATAGDTLATIAKRWKVDAVDLQEQNLFKYSKAPDAPPNLIGKIKRLGLTMLRSFYGGELLRMPRKADPADLVPPSAVEVAPPLAELAHPIVVSTHDPTPTSPSDVDDETSVAHSGGKTGAGSQPRARPYILRCKDTIQRATGMQCQNLPDLQIVMASCPLPLPAGGAHRSDFWLTAVLQLMRALGKGDEIPPDLVKGMEELGLLNGAPPPPNDLLPRNRNVSAASGGADTQSVDELFTISDSRISDNACGGRLYKTAWRDGTVTWEDRDSFCSVDGTVAPHFLEFEQQRTGLIGSVECDWHYATHSEDVPMAQPDSHNTITCVEGDTLEALGEAWRVSASSLFSQNLFRLIKTPDSPNNKIGRESSIAALISDHVFSAGTVLRLPKYTH
eukprot:m.307369 g.307369  ORF g.307369 m.307369 type:complete len:1576 (-) comp27382_c0_seq1:237-4964(-)